MVKDIENKKYLCLVRLKTSLIVGTSLISLITCPNAVGAENNVEFGLSAEGVYDDNRFLNTTNKQSVYILNLRPTLALTVEDEGMTTVFTARGAYALSSDQAVQQDRFTYGAGVLGTYQYEYSTLSFGASYDRDDIANTEFEDTGIFINNGVRDRAGANFGYQYQLNETWNIRVSDDFQLVDYSTQNFNNYWSNTAGLGIDVAINDKTSLVQNFSFLHYEPELSLLAPLNSYSYLAGISHALSEDTSVTITGGASYVDGSYRWSAVGEITHERENNQLTLRAARELQPSGLGGIRQTESVAFNTTYNYSEGTNVGLNTSWRRSKDLSDLIQLKNEFISLSPWVSFEVIRDLRVRLSYQLRRQKIGFTNDWGVSNAFFISIAY